jgi:hypothetical protein
MPAQVSSLRFDNFVHIASREADLRAEQLASGAEGVQKDERTVVVWSGATKRTPRGRLARRAALYQVQKTFQFGKTL